MEEGRAVVDWNHSVAQQESPAASCHSPADPLQTAVKVFQGLMQGCCLRTGLAGRKIESMMTLNLPAWKVEIVLPFFPDSAPTLRPGRRSRFGEVSRNSRFGLHRHTREMH